VLVRPAAMPVGQLLPLTWSTRRHKYAHLEFDLLVILLIFMYMEFVYIQFCFLFSLQYTVLCCIIIYYYSFILYCKHERVERSLRNYGAIVSLSQETVQRILAKAPSLYEEEVH
jgi:hypothetical protein